MTFYKPTTDEDRERISNEWYSFSINEYSNEIHEWLHSSKNIKHHWYLIHGIEYSMVLFEDQDECVLFKMIWI